jgi:heat-inducible transcriptional repressor
VKTLKAIDNKRPGKEERERKVLLGLVDYYLKTNKPVGSNTLKEAGFEDLSSATIRNYFAHLEEQDYLKQQHSSGGRIPTHKAYRFYADFYLDSDSAIPLDSELMIELRNSETHEIASFLQKAAEYLSLAARAAVFLSAPRFDHDVLVNIKLVPINDTKCLCVLITDFGLIQTELVHTEMKLSSFTVKRLESYFYWRLTANNKPENLTPEEEKLAQGIYNELIVRYIVGYSNFTSEEVYRTGFSQLLSYPEFHDPISLSNSLALFENAHGMRLLLKECGKMNRLKYWLGNDLAIYTKETPDCAVIAIPYYINQQVVGAVGLLGPARIPYRELFRLMRTFSYNTSTALTHSIYKYKIKFRQPEQNEKYVESEQRHFLGQTQLMLIEDKRQ